MSRSGLWNRRSRKQYTTLFEREIKSHSEAVSKSNTENPVVTLDKFKSAVKSAIKEEDRSRNLIVFGLYMLRKVSKWKKKFQNFSLS